MKKLLLLLILTVSTFACSKDDDEVNRPNDQAVENPADYVKEFIIDTYTTDGNFSEMEVILEDIAPEETAVYVYFDHGRYRTPLYLQTDHRYFLDYEDSFQLYSTDLPSGHYLAEIYIDIPGDERDAFPTGVFESVELDWPE